MKIDLKGASQCLDQILDIPADQWAEEHLQVYELLKSRVEKYKTRYSEVQFRLDLRDIQKNIHTQDWYQESPFQKALDWYLEQLEITSYGHSTQKHHFKVTAFFSKIKVQLTIYHREKLQILLEKNQLKSDLSRPDKIAELFNLNRLDLEEKDRKRLVYDIINLITEIAFFYQS